jgi:hypothetical protein
MPRWRLTMTIPRILTACGILLAWPAHNADAVSTAAVSGVDINHCLRIANNQAKPDEAHCPGFIVTTLIDARNTCREVGGKIRTYPPTKLWSIDVNADGQPEYLFDYSQNVGCDDAESVFSCGSLGCGLSLFAWRDDQWRIIGNLPDDPTAIEAVPASGQGGYADLRAVCVGCTEIQRYRWSGHDYALAGLEVRGHAVDIPSVRGQLWMLTPAMSQCWPNQNMTRKFSAATRRAPMWLFWERRVRRRISTYRRATPANRGLSSRRYCAGAIFIESFCAERADILTAYVQ